MKKTSFAAAVAFCGCVLVMLMAVFAKGPAVGPVPEEKIFVTIHSYINAVDLQGNDGKTQLYDWQGKELPWIFFIRNGEVFPITEDALNLPPIRTEVDFKK